MKPDIQFFERIDMPKWIALAALSLGVLIAIGTTSVWAHDFEVSTSMALGDTHTEEHEDAADWAGWLNLTVTNNGSEAWGDFHFEIYEVSGSVENVDWDVTENAPYSNNQTGLTYTFDNDPITGAVLNLFFYDDPVQPGETADFHVHNVNPDQVAFFGTKLYPTPVPAPAALWLLGSGLVGLMGWRRWTPC